MVIPGYYISIYNETCTTTAWYNTNEYEGTATYSNKPKERKLIFIEKTNTAKERLLSSRCRDGLLIPTIKLHGYKCKCCLCRIKKVNETIKISKQYSDWQNKDIWQLMNYNMHSGKKPYEMRELL
jgi:hypothetical protein